MAKNRIELHHQLEQSFGVKAYYQPPESMKLTYPCVVYSFETFNTRNANNMPFVINERYKVSYLHKNVDDSRCKAVLRDFDKITHTQHYVTNGVYNDIYYIYI